MKKRNLFQVVFKRGMIFISLKKFRIIDMAVLIGIGVVVELFSMGVLFRGNGLKPTFVVSVIIILTCLTRWGIKGLVSAPILALVTWTGGRLFIDTIANVPFKVYDWMLLVSMLVGNCSVGLVCIVYKKYGTLRICSSRGNVMLIALVTSVLCITVESSTYLCLSLGNTFMFNLFLYDLIGMVVTVILSAALFSQGIMTNFVEKRKKEQEAAQEEAEYEKKYMSELNNVSSNEEKE